MSICGCRRATCSLITWVCFLRYTRIATFLWPPCVADADIIFSSCSLFFFLVFFHRLISAVADWISTILHTWCGLSANLGCRSETCHVLHVARQNTGRKNRQKFAIYVSSHNFFGLYLFLLYNILN